MTGKVKWFNSEKGYGFITSDQGNDVFVHYSSIQGNNYRTLAENDTVEFDVVTDAKGSSAANVTKI